MLTMAVIKPFAKGRWVPGVLGVAQLAAQVITPDEIRVSGKPYVVHPSFRVEARPVEIVGQQRRPF
jgi:hypothetical protein